MNSSDNEVGSFPDRLVGKRIVVTGGAGSVGTELVDQLLRQPVELVRVIDNNELGIFRQHELHGGTNRCEALFCDIRDDHELIQRFPAWKSASMLLRRSMYLPAKHSPFSAVQTNIIGTQQASAHRCTIACLTF